MKVFCTECDSQSVYAQRDCWWNASKGEWETSPPKNEMPNEGYCDLCEKKVALRHSDPVTYTLQYQQVEEFTIKVTAESLPDAIEFVHRGGFHMDAEEAQQEFPNVYGHSDHNESGTRGCERTVWHWKEEA